MRRVLLAALLSVGCASAKGRPCSPDDVRAVRMKHERAAVADIRAGKCEGYSSVDDCPNFRMHELAFTLEVEELPPCH